MNMHEKEEQGLNRIKTWYNNYGDTDEKNNDTIVQCTPSIAKWMWELIKKI